MKLNGSEFMLAEERFARILSILEESGSVTVAELMERLDASESTIRRDLNSLDARGQLIKVAWRCHDEGCCFLPDAG